MANHARARRRSPTSPLISTDRSPVFSRSAQVSDLAANIDRQVSSIPLDQTPLLTFRFIAPGSAFRSVSQIVARINHRVDDRHLGHQNGRGRAIKGDLRSWTCTGSETLAQRGPSRRPSHSACECRRRYRASAWPWCDGSCGRPPACRCLPP
jgi:hypothetical protein